MCVHVSVCCVSVCMIATYSKPYLSVHLRLEREREGRGGRDIRSVCIVVRKHGEILLTNIH